MRAALWIAAVLTPLSDCRWRAEKPDDSAAPVDTVDTVSEATPRDSRPDSPTDSAVDSPPDSPMDTGGGTVDTVSSATETGDTGHEPLPVGELVLLEQAEALILGQAWMVESGVAVAGVGDFDGDGHDDFALGDSDADWDNAGGGATLLFSGATATGELSMLSDWDLRLESLGYNEGGGAGMAPAGDVDGDGHDDIAMVARSAWYNGYDPYEGYVHLWWGPPAPGVTELGTTGSDVRVTVGDYGDPVLAAAGDVNGDGLRDLLVGLGDHDQFPGGVAWVLTGPDLDRWAAITSAEHDACGSAVAGAGDVDGDGYDDVIVGAPQDRPASTPGAAGFAGVLRGGASVRGELMLGSAFARLVGSRGLHRDAGYAVACAGDVDGDHRSDLSVAATLLDAHGAWAGEQATLHPGADIGGGGVIAIDDGHARFQTSERGARYVRLSLAGPGDLDGDGAGDWLVGAPGHGADSGVAYLFLGAGLDAGGDLGVEHAHYQLLGAGAGGFGASLAVAGDVDADGRDELLLGGPDYDTAGATALFGLPE
jgi:hypothetical protein